MDNDEKKEGGEEGKEYNSLQTISASTTPTEHLSLSVAGTSLPANPTIVDLLDTARRQAIF
jgi:hypothetical protein